MVIGKLTGVDTGNSALILLAIGDVHQCIAARHRAGGTVISGRQTGAHDAAHIALAAEGTFGIAVAHHGAGQTGNTAHIAAAVAADAAVALGLGDKPQIHPAADTAHIAALARHHTVVDAALHDGLVLILPPIAGTQAGRDVVLRIQLVFHRHGAGDAAGIHVAVHRALVPALGILTPCYLVNVHLRGIRDHIRGVIHG